MGSVLTDFLFKSDSDLEFSSYQLLILTGAKVNKATFIDKLNEHPDYPSLLSVKDTFDSFGLNTLAVRLDSKQLPEIDIPFLTQISTSNLNTKHFTVVRPVAKDRWEYLDSESRKWIALNESDLIKRFSSLALFTEANEKSGEVDFEKVKRQNRSELFITCLKILLLPLSAIGILLTGFFFQSDLSGSHALYLLTMIFGALTSGLLVLYEVDKHNPILKNVCSGTSKKVNCHAVLNSEGSKFLGISWSLMGFSYFLGGATIFVISYLNGSIYLPILSLLSLLAVPYVFYSFYYQAFVVKQWCRLCLAIQFILIFQTSLVLSAGWYKNFSDITLQIILSSVFIYLLFFIIGEILIVNGKKAKEGKKHHKSFIRLKSNIEIFQSLLMKQRSFENNSDDIGIILGNPEAKNTLIKVCNPYCGPCAKAHPGINNLLLQNPNLKVQIIFTVTGEEDDIRTPSVRHLLAIASGSNDFDIKIALNDWYLADQKNYEIFAAKYPLNEDLKQQDKAIEKMNAWCKSAEVTHTPTYFLNGRELPSIYALSDLEYFLKDL